MFKTTLMTVTLLSVIAFGVSGSFGPATAHGPEGYSRGYGMGPGMMGPGYGMGPGMMGQGYGMGPGMMGPGYGMGPGMMGQGYGMGPGMMGQGMMMGPGMTGQGYGMGPGSGTGPGMIGPGYGMWGGRKVNLTTDDVRKNLERWLAWQGNPRLKVGEVKEEGDDAILADIVTKEGSALVDRMRIDRSTGAMQRIE